MVAKFKIWIWFFLVMAVSAFLCVDAFSQSLSDMDQAGFRKLKGQYEAKTRTDPFASGSSAADELAVEDLELTGIAYKESGPSFALISTYSLKVGDKIAGYKVDAIERDRVRLRRLDEVLVLALGGGR